MKAYRHMMARGGGIRLLAHRLSKLKTAIVPMLVIGVMAAWAPRADASLLVEGASIPVVGIPFPGGVFLDSEYHSNVGAGNTLVDLSAAVFRTFDANPFLGTPGGGVGTIDFYYQVNNDSALNIIHRLTGGGNTGELGFTGFKTDVWYVSDGAAVPCGACPGGSFVTGDTPPITADRDSSGEVVGFQFGVGAAGVLPTDTSFVLLVRTDATDWDPGIVSAINGGTTTEDAFQPAPGITPEPASLLLFGIGLLGTGAAMRRKRKKA